MLPSPSRSALLAVLFFAAAPCLAAEVYACTSRTGHTTYTSEPSAACRSQNLPSVGSYHGGGYRLHAKATSGQTAKPKKSRKNTKTARAKALRQAKAEGSGNSARPSEKGRGFGGFAPARSSI